MADEQDNILRQARERFERAAEADRENAEEAHDDLKFLVGEQWPEDIKREREADGRPVITIPRLGQFIRQVTGDIRINSPAIRVRPSGKESNKAVADVLTGLIRNIEQVSDASTAYITAAESAAGCGIGHFRVVTEYSDDDGFEQDIRIRRILNPFSVTWDPEAEALTRADANYCFVTARLPLEEFKERWPDANTSDFETTTENREYVGEWWDGETVRIAEYWCKKPVVKNLNLMADGAALDDEALAKANTEAALQRIDPPVVKRTRQVQTHEVVHYILNGVEVIEGPVTWPGRHIPIISVVGEEVHIGDRTVRSGIIRYAKDAQRLYNYMRSTAVEAGALQPKAPFIATPNQVKGHENQWREANRRNVPYLLYNPDGQAPGAPQRQLPAPIAAGFEQEAGIAVDDMKATTGIYDASLGQRSNETSGKAILARQREGDVGTFVYADKLAKAIGHCGRILVDLIPRIYTAERMVRVLGEDDEENIVPVNSEIELENGETFTLDLSTGEYDVVVQTGPSYSTKRAEAADSMMQFVKAVPGAAALISDLVAKNMDWPGAETIAERLKKALPPGIADDGQGQEQTQPQQPDPIALAKLKKLLAEADKTEAQAQGEKADAIKTELEIAQDMGGVNQLIVRMVQQALMQLLGPPQQGNGAQPDPGNVPGFLSPTGDPGDQLL